GSYSYQLDDNTPKVNALKDNETLDEVFTYTLTDGDGDSDNATLTITINGRTDNPPTITPDDNNGPDDPNAPGYPVDPSDPDYPSDPNFDPSNPVTSQGHTTVHERGLTGVDSSHINTGSIAVTAPDGLSSINVGGVDVSLTELLNLGSTPVEIDTPAGKLTLTGFTPTADVGGVPTAGELTFSYELETPQDTPE